MVRRASGLGIASCLLALSAACGARPIELPADPGTVLAGFSTIHADVSDACRDVRTLTAVLALSGRAGGERLGGDVHTGIQRPAALRLEGVHPFGATVFVLVADRNGATLLLPREARVVRDARAEAILGALTGIALAPADLQAVLTGCVVPDPQAISGRAHEGGWISIGLEGGARLYLQRVDSVWRVRTARRENWRIDYPEWREGSPFPQRVVLRSEMPVRVDLRAEVSDVEVNVELPDSAFSIEIPSDAVPLSLEALREAGPLRQAEDGESGSR